MISKEANTNISVQSYWLIETSRYLYRTLYGVTYLILWYDFVITRLLQKYVTVVDILVLHDE